MATPESPALELTHTTDPERLVLSRGNLFAVTTSTGDMEPAGARELGLFHEDTRHLSHYRLVLPGPAPTRLSSETSAARFSQIDLTGTHTEEGNLLDEPVNFLHVRRKQLLGEDFVEQLVFTNFLGRPVSLSFELHFAADFADVFEVRGAHRPRRGETLTPGLGDDWVELRYRGTDGQTYFTTLRFRPAPVALDASRARFRMDLEPGEAQVGEIAITPGRGAQAPARPDWPFHVTLARTQREPEGGRNACTRVSSDNAFLARGLEQALIDVLALRILHDRRWIVGAGIPWFAAPFGRDSVITSAQMLATSPDLARETLRFLAAYQGKTDDEVREEEPGKIMHELRRGEMVRAGEIPHSPYYGSIDSTPLYVVLTGETFSWTADRELLDELWPSVRAAMEWLERHTQGGTRFLTYQRRTPRGLENQGWKDSRDGVSFPDGRRAISPIALVEVQGYVVDAYRHGARIARERGELELADTWESRVGQMMRRIVDAFWAEETRYFALALDGHGRQVPTKSSNPGHLLWSRAVQGTGQAARIGEVLLGPEMYTGWGIRTVGRGQTVYNPLSYHNGSVWPHDNAIAALGLARYGLSDQAMRVLDGMFAASMHFRNGRLPELFCGMSRGEGDFLVQYPVSCSPQAWASGALFMLLQASLGLSPDAPSGGLRIHNPRLPDTVRRLDLKNMRVGSARVSLRFTRPGKRTHCDVLDVTGGKMRVEIEID